MAGKRPGSAVNADALSRFGTQTALQLRAGIERSRHPMLMVDDQRRWVTANAAAEQLLGAASRELTWSTMDEFTPPSGRQRLEEQWQAFLARGAAEGWYELIVPDRGRVSVEFSAVANVLPARHLSIFIPPEAIDLGAPDSRPAKKPGWGVVTLAGPVPPARLTRREREVITLIAGGGQSGDMAARLVLSPATIRSHAENAMSKLGVRTRAHAVAVALVTGQIEWSMYDASGAVAADP